MGLRFEIAITRGDYKLTKFKDLGIENVQLVLRSCSGCAHLTTGRTEDDKDSVRCEAFITPYPLWEKEEQVYDQCPAGKPARGYKPSTAEALACYTEDVHKPLYKAGGGEKQDRTHKLFPRERMKDNRPKYDIDEV